MSRWIAGVYAAVLVGAGIAVVQLPASDGGSWLAILWATWIAAMVWALTRPSFSVLFVAVMAAMFLFVILPATEAQLTGLTTIAGNNYGAGVVRALEISALAQCGLLAGAVAARTLRPVPSLTRLSPRLSASRLDRAALRSTGTGILAILALSALGGASLGTFFVYATPSGYGTFAQQTAGNLGYLVALQSAAGLALVLLPLRLSCLGSSRMLGLFYAALATFVLIGNGQRGRFFVPVIAAGLVWLKTSRRSLPPRRLAAAGVLALLLFSGFVGVARGAASSRQLSAGSVVAASAGSSEDLFLPLAGLASTVPGEVPYLHGTSYLDVAEFLVPRVLWHGKPEDAIAEITTVMDPGNSGLALPEFGEMYANFGLPGVIVGSLLLGALIEWLSRRLARSASLRESVFIAVCGAVVLVVFTRGAVAPMLAGFAGLLVATGLVCRRRSGVLAAAAAPVPSGPLKPGQTRNPVATTREHPAAAP